MNLLLKSGGPVVVGFVLMCALEVGEHLSIPGVHSLVPEAQAVVGRPLTPVSVAGVARRTARRN
ncbi:hypothetical protein CQ065_24990 [Pseudomonas sp. MYb187]|uniref:hypothetical protein n=1 Tax=Pseudomonas TaxID=286 RepID=UPI000CFDA0ED|nr:hypothetical protein [Pseudomonas sp. MYb187]PRA56813.1 hypothetical protein CQ065_24990 [Pseudomonas sp. MYb187]